MTTLHPRVVACKVLALEGSSRLHGFFQRPGSEHFDVFRATDGRLGEGEELFDRRAFHARYGRPPRPGEIGCAVSHYLILKEFARAPGKGTDLLVVAEDDARLSPRAVEVINRIASRVRDIDLGILAGVTGSVDKTHVLDLGQVMAQLSLGARIIGWSGATIYRFGRVEGDARCTGFYVVSRAAAKRYMKLVDVLGKISWFADEYYIVVGLSGGNLSALRPDLASWEGETTIGGSAPEPYDGGAEGVASRIRGLLSLRTRLKRLRGSVAASLRELADRVTVHAPRYEGREADRMSALHGEKSDSLQISSGNDCENALGERGLR